MIRSVQEAAEALVAYYKIAESEMGETGTVLFSGINPMAPPEFPRALCTFTMTTVERRKFAVAVTEVFT